MIIHTRFLGLFVGFFGLASILASNSSPSWAALPAEFETRGALEKQEYLWNEISSSEYAQIPTGDLTFWQKSQLLLPWFLAGAFTNTSDEMTVGRPKLLHTYGTVAIVRMEINPTGVDGDADTTGIFNSGGSGLVRLSLGTQSGAYLPGMALKIFVDGAPSVNFHVMYSLEGQGENHNFFELPFSNVIPTPTSTALRIAQQVFHNALYFISKDAGARPESELALPLGEAAQITNTGLVSKSAKVPYQIIFYPNPSIGFSYSTHQDLRSELGETIKSGSELYSIGIRRFPDSKVIMIGRLVTESRFVASKFGDENLYFRHQSRR